MRVSARNARRGAQGLRNLGTVAGKFNNSNLGTVFKVANPKLGMVSKGVEKYAPKVANLIDRGADLYEKHKGIVDDVNSAVKDTVEDFA